MGRPGGTQASPGLRVVGVHSVGVWGPALAAAAESREWAESGMARKPPPQLVGQRVPTRTLLAPPGSSGSWSALPVVLTGQDPLCTFPACRTRVAEAALGAFWTWGVDLQQEEPCRQHSGRPYLLAAPSVRQRQQWGERPLVATRATAGTWREPSLGPVGLRVLLSYGFCQQP